MFMHRLAIIAILGASMMCVGLDRIQAQDESTDDVFSDFKAEQAKDEPDSSESKEEELPPAIETPGVAPEAPEQTSANSGVIESNEPLGIETIRERYANGKVKIQRQVTQDKEDNYINHGSWIWYDESGAEIASCGFRFGRRHGKASRLYDPDEAKLFQSAPFNQFTGPYKSTAEFDSGLLHGDWIIFDNSDRKICQWAFKHGRRHGKSTWWYSTGQVMREINYSDGELHGELIENTPSGAPATKVEYINGRRHEKLTKKNDKGENTVEGMVLRARLSLKTRDDWWTVEIAKYTEDGKDEKHGRWTAWHPNGQKKLVGEYQYDQPSGEFSWWHDNGQKSIQAYYAAGKKEGFWIWWHPNGQKSIQGSYAADSPVGRWTWWNEQGKVDKKIDFSSNGSKVTSQPRQARRSRHAN